MKTRNNLLLYTFIACLCFGNESCSTAPQTENSHTMCNPLPLDYQFTQDDGVLRRDGAHPCVVLFNERYYLFLSNMKGYYTSDDLLHWQPVSANLPAGGAPAAVVMNGKIYLTFSDATHTFYCSDSPETGRWETATDGFPYKLAEPSLFYENGRLFLYAGSGNKVPLTGMEIDPQTWTPLSPPTPLIHNRKQTHGWEVAGDYHDWKSLSSWIEGTWMTKRNGMYYLQYAGSGVQYTGSAQGVYVSRHPLGPFTLAAHNPFAYKPEGFTKGAGNGCLFQDKFGNDWYLCTTIVSVRHIFERRLALHPVFFDSDGLLYAATTWGDYPLRIPARKTASPEELSTGWMLLSYRKPVKASSEQRKHPACCATDENIRTWWSATTGDAGEFLSVDLEQPCEVQAIQVNFADEGWEEPDSVAGMYQYQLEASDDGRRWQPIGENALRKSHTPHDYMVLPAPLKKRYFRITNVCMPGGNFSLSGFRLFGKADKLAPGKATACHGLRNVSDRRDATFRWRAAEGAVGYVVRYGASPDKLYHSYLVYDDTEITLKGLHAEWEYYFRVDSFNEGGITRGESVEKVNEAM